jgi:tetratricopeptide (TPR) repeat protein
VRLTDECDVITVEPMEQTTALALLSKKLGTSETTEDMWKLAVALDHMPLALAQAGAYIRQRGSRCSVGRYLAKLEQSENSQTRLLMSASKELRRDEEARNSIILTWQITFDHIRATRPSAANLLSRMSMYNYQGIPEYLLKAEKLITSPGLRLASGPSRIERDSDTISSLSDDEFDFDDDVLTLENFHLISTHSSNASFEMHRLVQLAARIWLHSHGTYQDYLRESIESLDEAFPGGEFEDWARSRELYPHVTSILQLEDKKFSLTRASIRYNAAWFDSSQGLWADAEASAAECYMIRATLLGVEDKETLSALILRASILTRQGKYDAAAEMCRQALEGREKVLGRGHPDTLTTLRILASVLARQGNYDAAEEASRRVLEGHEKMLGKEHPDTMTSLNNLASLLSLQGKYEAAEQAHRRVLEVRVRLLGTEHPDTLTSVADLGSILRDQGNDEAAEIMQRRSLEGFEKVLGREHPDTLTALGNLAIVLGKRGDHESAEETTRRVLEGREKVLGSMHPDTLLSVWYLADLMERLGRKADAISLYRRAEAGFTTTLGTRHPHAVQCCSSLKGLED